jgi:predicted nucleic acid-binding Zn ribbon protein
MGSSSFPEIPCVVCRKPVDLQTDVCADENGKAMHTDCYVKRITSARLAQAWANRFSLSANSEEAQRQQGML